MSGETVESGFSLARASQANLGQDKNLAKLLQAELKFIPAFKLMNALSKEAQPENQNENFAPKVGEFVFNRKVLGKQFRAVPISYRAKAIYFKNRQLEAQSYDQDSETFKMITEGSNDKVHNYLYGPEVLFWLPDESAFALYHFTKTARFHAPSFIASIGKPSIVYSDRAENSSGDKWYTCMCKEGDFEMNSGNSPTEEFYNRVLDLFSNPKDPDEDKEKAPEKQTKSRKR